MPAKKYTLTDAERAKRIRETAREIGTDQSPKALERVFKKVVPLRRSAKADVVPSNVKRLKANRDN